MRTPGSDFFVRMTLLACLGALAQAPTARAAADLVVETLTAPSPGTDCRTGAVNGTIDVVVLNQGTAVAPAPVELFAFEDENRNGVYDAGVDEDLGSGTMTADLAAGEMVTVTVAVSGTLLFRDAPIVILLDATDAVAEDDEANNRTDTGFSCYRRPPAGVFDPEVEWHWTGVEVDSTPMVGDVDADGFPDVVFVAEDQRVRCLDGRDGSLTWETTGSPAIAIWSMPALGELDGDPGLETVALENGSNRLVAFDDDGTVLWLGDPMTRTAGSGLGAVSLADLDCDGTPEAIYGVDVFDARDGTRFWTPAPGGTFSENSGFSGMSVAVDVDDDGTLELLAGPTAYKWNPATGMGEILWTQPSVPDGNVAVGNFDADDGPEVALTGSGRVALLEGDTGAVIWNQAFPTGGGGCSAFSARVGAPTIADFDGDGQPEIGASGADWYVVYEADGSELWRAPIDDCSSHFTASTVFDFEDDGSAEVVYQDEVAIRVLRGTDGTEVASLAASSLTWEEMATIADVDGDGNAEILSPLNRHRGSTLQGVRAWGDTLDNWVSARRIWNQHAYHVGHVGDDGTIGPGAGSCEEKSWLTHNTFRKQLAGQRGGEAVANLTTSVLELDVSNSDDCLPVANLVVRVGNAGSERTGSAVDLYVFDGDPGAGASLIDMDVVPDLAPGEFADFSFSFIVSPAGLGPLHVLVDDDGTGPASGVVSECENLDNRCVTERVEGGNEIEPPAAVGTALFATGHGPATDAIVEADFEWSGDEGLPRPAGEHYHVWTSRAPDRLVLVDAGHPITATTWTEASPQATRRPTCTYVRVVAADPCELEEVR